jgi:hypothetical protein
MTSPGEGGGASGPFPILSRKMLPGRLGHRLWKGEGTLFGGGGGLVLVGSTVRFGHGSSDHWRSGVRVIDRVKANCVPACGQDNKVYY